MHRVALGVTSPEYSSTPPFHPGTHYPELPFSQCGPDANPPYELLRVLFLEMGMDSERFGTPEWNPFTDLIHPGNTVVLKPNFVLSDNTSGGGLFSVVTHPSILRALTDYAFLALKGSGRIIIADVPQMDCNWDQLMASQHLDSIQAFYREQFGFEIETYDLREFAILDPKETAYSTNRTRLPGDPQGSIVINLGEQSEFFGLPSENYYGADFNRDETIVHHHGSTHEYCVSKTILDADVFISVPKLKVHKKVGVTLNLKGLVGINTNKNYLIHYRVGTPTQGGDQLPDSQPAADRILIRIQRKLYDLLLARQNRFCDALYRFALGFYRVFIKPFRKLSTDTLIQDGGNWHGNDSAWRMTADLAKILFFADSKGKLHPTPQRRMFCVIDGIIGGENNGPLSPDPKPAGALVMGSNPFAVDLAATRLMGFDPAKVKQFSILAKSRFDFGVEDISEIEIVSPQDVFRDLFTQTEGLLNFRPHPGWVGQLEVKEGK